MVVLNQDDGKVESTKCFDTFKSSEEIDAFVKQGVPEGRIILAACQDECTKNLSQTAK